MRLPLCFLIMISLASCQSILGSGDDELDESLIGVEDGGEMDSDSMDDTIDGMLEQVGITTSDEVKDVLSFLTTKNISHTTMRAMLRAVSHEIPMDQRHKYMRVASRLDGLHRKKLKAMKRLVNILHLNETQSQELSEYMKTKKLSAIIDEAKAGTLGGGGEGTETKLKNLVQEMQGWGKVNLGEMEGGGPKGKPEVEDNTMMQ